MSNITTTFRGKATLEASSNPVIYNVTLTLANTEYSQALNSNTKKFMIRNRNSSGNLKVAFVATQSGTLYFTIPRGTTFFEDQLLFSGTIYIQSDVAGNIVEILEWS